MAIGKEQEDKSRRRRGSEKNVSQQSPGEEEQNLGQDETEDQDDRRSIVMR